MSWTIACFCGNVYTAPPDRCDACGSTLDHAATRPTASTTDVYALAVALG
jgi:rRNA maturation endonuclease Nob1